MDSSDFKVFIMFIVIALIMILGNICYLYKKKKCKKEIQVDNENGICLLFGFSQNAMKVAVNREKETPYESLIQVLDGPRYEKVENAIAGLVV